MDVKLPLIELKLPRLCKFCQIFDMAFMKLPLVFNVDCGYSYVAFIEMFICVLISRSLWVAFLVKKVNCMVFYE